ncbi:2-keto-4-pentenoate hydratase [Pseudonocardia sp. H11422]|uniref:2-keto-4-pentenoate hydratase n=1 Tax=Pseudonocardia sp. H11422 TaxID=2835866 RepID=UPI001BDD520B|nr:fumarylacetoacetate hydrolase family protein [Pseudonocardia sp. H11422]
MPGAPSAGVESAAERLLAAARSRTPCSPVRDVLPDGSAETACAVQTLLTRHALRSGKRIVGRKIGLTSAAVQRQLGVGQPDFGVLFDDMHVTAGAVVDSAALLQPKIEAEIAFVLCADLDSDGLDADAVRAAVDYVVPALEIVDSRIAGWDITFADTVADNASSGLFVLGATATELGDLDLRSVKMTLVDDSGATLSSGTGAACLGDPVEAVLWLARTCRDLGSPLRAGEIVLSGALGPMVTVAEDAMYTATVGELGTVSAGFSGARRHVTHARPVGAAG